MRGGRGRQILATDVVQLVAGGRGRAGSPFDAVGALELKGLPEPVPAVRGRLGAARPSRPVPLPALLTASAGSSSGRDGELERLGQLWKEAAAGELRVALLAGEPGVGKTRLAAELGPGRPRARARPCWPAAATRTSACPTSPSSRRCATSSTTPRTLAERLGRYGGELARLVPELAERVPGLPAPLRSDPETERYRLFDAVAAWLAAASADEPVLLVLDDLQWAAKPTLLLLRHIVRGGRADAAARRSAPTGTPSCRHDHPLVELLADLRRQAGVERLLAHRPRRRRGGGLHGAGGGPQPRRRGARPGPGRSTRRPRATRSSSGEVLRHLAETGAVERQDGGGRPGCPSTSSGSPKGSGRWSAGGSPACPRTTNQVLRVAAVVGPEFELAVVAGGRRSRRGDVDLRAVEEAAAARLHRRGARRTRVPLRPRPGPGHLYETLSAARRVALHRRVAEAIETVHALRLDDHLPALAHHWARARRPGPRRPGRSTTPPGPATGRWPSSPTTRRPPTTAKRSSCWTPDRGRRRPAGRTAHAARGGAAPDGRSGLPGHASWRPPVWPSAAATPTAWPGLPCAG